MCVLFPSTKDDMTFPRAESDKLILVASFNRVPCWIGKEERKPSGQAQILGLCKRISYRCSGLWLTLTARQIYQIEFAHSDVTFIVSAHLNRSKLALNWRPKGSFGTKPTTYLATLDGDNEDGVGPWAVLVHIRSSHGSILVANIHDMFYFRVVLGHKWGQILQKIGNFAWKGP